MCALVTGVQTCALPIYVRRLVQAEEPAEVTLLRDYDPSIPEITIDREQIIKAVLNVLRNALQAVGCSEARRVGKECVSMCRSRWAPYHYNTKSGRRQIQQKTIRYNKNTINKKTT